MRRPAPLPCGEIVSNLTLQSIVLVMLGSGLGGGARLWLSTLVQRASAPAFPWGTLFVNVAGCLLVGALGALHLVGRNSVVDLLRQRGYEVRQQ